MRKRQLSSRRYSALAVGLVAVISMGCTKKQAPMDKAVVAEEEAADVAAESAGEQVRDAGITMQSDEEPIILEPSE